MDRIDIGPSPAEEACAQLGQENYTQRAKTECRIFAEQIVRCYGTPPEDCVIKTHPNRYESGTYYEVAMAYDDTSEAATVYAYAVESDEERRLEKWDEQARKDLIEAGYLQAA